MQKFFLTGPNRTGTTLLCRCIDDHPRCVCLFESNIHTEAFGGIKTVGHSGRMKKHGFSPEQTKALRKKIQPGNMASILNWYDECAHILGELYDKPELTHIGDKNPYFNSSRGFVKEIKNYPKIWTIRDPRAVWYSGRAKKKDYLDPYLRNVMWFLPRMDDSTLIIRFEDFVLDPKTTMKKVFEFLGVSYDESYLCHKPNKYDRRFKWNPNSVGAFDPSQLKKWTNVPSKVLEMEWVKKVMKKFGYE